MENETIFEKILKELTIIRIFFEQSLNSRIHSDMMKNSKKVDNQNVEKENIDIIKPLKILLKQIKDELYIIRKLFEIQEERYRNQIYKSLLIDKEQYIENAKRYKRNIENK